MKKTDIVLKRQRQYSCNYDVIENGKVINTTARLMFKSEKQGRERFSLTEKYTLHTIKFVGWRYGI